MRQQVERRKCDNCGTMVEEVGTSYGGSPFHGWLTVETTNGSSRVPRPARGPWDFCGTGCCMEFLEGGKNG